MPRLLPCLLLPAAALAAEPRLAPRPGAGPVDLHLDQAPLTRLVATFETLTDRAFLLAPMLPEARFTCPRTPDPLSPREASRTLETLLARQGIHLTPVGDRLAVLHPAKPPLALPARPRIPVARPGPERRIRLQLDAASPDMAIDLYAFLVDRTRLPAGELPPDPLPLHTHTPLTPQDAAHALELLFTLHGYEVLPLADDFLRVRPPPATP